MTRAQSARQWAGDIPKEAVSSLADELRDRGTSKAQSAFAEWMDMYGALYGERFLRPGPGQTRALSLLYGISGETSFHELLFCVHTHLALLIQTVASKGGARVSLKNTTFDWAGPWAERMVRPAIAAEPGRDAFKPLCQSLIPREVRHGLGEYYTPDWLAEFVLNETGYDGDPRVRLLDPACGTGTFLVLAIQRAKQHALRRREAASETASRILNNIHGFEVNPLAALAARANYLLALSDLPGGPGRAEAPVDLVDAILQVRQTDQFDFVVGNPPWVRWDYLAQEYREATLPLWKHYGLFSLKGFEARLGGGKKDLSMLFTYSASDNYLKAGGRLGFVITQEVFKSKGAGEGFRRFRLGEHGEPLRVLKAHDFSKIQPFEGATNKTAVVVLTKGEETAYPLPYFVWRRKGEALEREALLARPIGSARGPWRTFARDPAGHSPLEGVNPYRAMLGANANPYGVFWLDVKEVLPGGMARVRNLVEKGKQQIAVTTAVIESDLVFPALRGSDITRWRAEPGVWVLVVQDPRTRRGHPETLLRERWPQTYSYLLQFRKELLARALYRKYHQEAGHPFYSQFNIAQETFCPYKVVWKRLSNDLVAAVISQWSGRLGSKMIVPLETTAFIATENAREAHYLCAILNSRPARDFIKSFSSAGRGFGTPSAIRHVRIPQFQEGNHLHDRLTRLSELLHERKTDSSNKGMQNLEAEIDALVSNPGF